MSREIKFRALDDGKMIYSHNNSINTNNFQLKWFFEKIRQDAIVMQFTGLKDKKGIEIYDGDICKVRYYNHSTPDSVLIQKVTYDLGTFSLVKEHTESKIEDDRTNVPLYYCFSPNEIEVIGNIYENANLLQ